MSASPSGMYSRGQAKPTNLVSRQIMPLELRFFQIFWFGFAKYVTSELFPTSNWSRCGQNFGPKNCDISGVKNRLKSAKNHHELVPVLGFGWKLIRKGKECIKKGFRCISEAYGTHHLVTTTLDSGQIGRGIFFFLQYPSGVPQAIFFDLKDVFTQFLLNFEVHISGNYYMLHFH